MEGHKIRWTKEDDETLLNNMNMPMYVLQHAFQNRTATAIKTRKRELRKIGKAEFLAARSNEMEHLHNEKTCAIPEDIKEMVEHKKQVAGTFKDIAPAVVQIKVEEQKPILSDELTRLRNRVSYLEGLVDGMKYVMEKRNIQP